MVFSGFSDFIASLSSSADVGERERGKGGYMLVCDQLVGQTIRSGRFGFGGRREYGPGFKADWCRKRGKLVFAVYI